MGGEQGTELPERQAMAMSGDKASVPGGRNSRETQMLPPFPHQVLLEAQDTSDTHRVMVKDVPWLGCQFRVPVAR